MIIAPSSRLQAVAGDHGGGGGGEEQRRLVMEAWEHQTGFSPVSCVLRDFEPACGRQGGGPEGQGPDLLSEAAFLAGQFNAKRPGLSRYVLLLCPMKA